MTGSLQERKRNCRIAHSSRCEINSGKVPLPTILMYLSFADLLSIADLSVHARVPHGPAGLNIAWADRNCDGCSVRCGGSAFHDWVKAIPSEAIVFSPLALDETQIPAFSQNSLASRVVIDGRRMSVARDTCGRWRSCLTCNLQPYRSHHEKQNLAATSNRVPFWPQTTSC